MTDMTATPAHRFTLGGALGFGFEVFRARPGAVWLMLAAQTVIYVVMALGQFLLLGHLARQGVMAADLGQSAEAFTRSMQFSLVSSLISFLGLPVWLWIEAVWLTLFMSGRLALWPGWAGIGRLCVSWLVLFGVYVVSLFVLVFVVMIAAIIAMLAAESGTGDSSLAAVLVAFVLSLIAALALITALSVFSGLPAHALSGRFDIGAAIKAGWRHVWGLTFAWILFFILYMLVMAVSYGLAALAVGDHVLSTLNQVIGSPDDPFLAMRLYARLLPGLDQAGISALVLTPIMLAMGLVMLVGRGISAKLALSMPNPSEKAD